MLGLAEYTIGARDLLTAAEFAEKRVTTGLIGVESRSEAVKIANSIYGSYYQTFSNEILDDTLGAIGENALGHYESFLDKDLDDREKLLRGVLNNTRNKAYYGASLNKRLGVNSKRLVRNIARSVLVGKGYQALQGVLTKRVPFGAQYDIDKRILLATATKLERDIAVKVAEESDIKLIKWNVSSFHPKPDICDDYAAYVDKSVVAYISQHDLDINPKGVYFADQFPNPPHPNCMCEFGYIVGRKEIARSAVKRSVASLRKLLGRLRRK